MTKKVLVFARDARVVRIFDVGASLKGRFYTAIFDVTSIKKMTSDWYDIYNKDRLIGFVSGVEEVREE